MNSAKPILVFKIGTSSITSASGTLDEKVMRRVAGQVAVLHKKYRIVIVSSGAVGTGKKFIRNYSGKIEERKAAAAIGNPILIHKYTQLFQPYTIPIAQSLCERGHFSDREKFLQMRDTFEELWQNGVIPIVNENDVVSSRELKFSDNDELATLLAVGFGADSLLIATSVEGVLDNKGKLVKRIEKIDSSVIKLATQERSSGGLGGMLSKLTCARLATRMGIKVFIFSARKENALLDALHEKTGTVCVPGSASASARQKWLASGSLVIGSVSVDEGAHKALLKRKSLLAVGVKKILNHFNENEAFEITDEQGNAFAIARAKVSSRSLEKELNQKNLVLAHADDIVLI
jgi:glutamate 5-kinase